VRQKNSRASTSVGMRRGPHNGLICVRLVLQFRAEILHRLDYEARRRVAPE
jgi:hypothetical protein